MDALALILAAGTCAVSLFAATLFVTRQDEPWLHRPLAILFLANALTYPSDIVELAGASADWEYRLVAFEAAPFYLVLPSLWAYVKGLTAEKPFRFERRHLWHLVFFVLSVLMAIGIWTVSPETRERLINGPLVYTPYEAFIGVLMNIVFLAQPIVTIGYATAIGRKLIRHRRRLKELFASTEQRELNWIGWLVLVFAIDQAATFLSDFVEVAYGSGFYDSPVDDLVDLILFWTLGLWGARQMPGLREGSAGTMTDVFVEPEPEDRLSLDQEKKYGRSALTEELRAELASRIERAMEKDALYLDPNLSLNKVASHLGEHANYVSQVINTTLQSTFFDYVNRWRIEAALPFVREGNKTIITIAYDAGFNSRSSFYKAFKKETGMTPTEYRQASVVGG